MQAQFDVSQVIEKRGVLAKIDWINPHTDMDSHVTEDGKVEEVRHRIAPGSFRPAACRDRQQERFQGRRDVHVHHQSQPRRLG